MNLYWVDYQSLKLFIINNPAIRNIEELAEKTGYCTKSVMKAMKALNIPASSKPKYCRG
jgi:hypothetical protein